MEKGASHEAADVLVQFQESNGSWSTLEDFNTSSTTAGWSKQRAESTIISYSGARNDQEGPNNSTHSNSTNESGALRFPIPIGYRFRLNNQPFRTLWKSRNFLIRGQHEQPTSRSPNLPPPSQGISFEPPWVSIGKLPVQRFKGEMDLSGLALTERTIGGKIIAEVDRIFESDQLCGLRGMVEALYPLLPNPHEADPNYNSTIVATEEILETNTTRLIVFAMTNGLSHLESVPVEEIVKFLARSENMAMLFGDYLKKMSAHVAKAFAQSLFQAALKEGEAQTVERLLATGLICVNRPCMSVTSPYWSKPSTPLEHAARFVRPRMTKVLLDSNADPNYDSCRADQEDADFLPWEPRGVLQHLYLAANESRRMTIDWLHTFNYLKQAGASQLHNNPHAYQNTLGQAKWTHELLELCVSFSNVASCPNLIDTGLLTAITSSLDDIKATMLARQFLLASERSWDDLLRPFQTQVDWAAITAAKRGQVDFVTLLLPYCQSIEGLLSAAIRGGNDTLIALILGKIPAIAGPGHTIDVYDHECASGYCDRNGLICELMTTPLAEAILSRSLSLARELECRGALNFSDQQDEFEAALAASATVGETEYVRKLLAHRPLQDPSSMLLALIVAIESDHEEVAIELLDAGADVNFHSTQCPLLSAIKQRNPRIVRAILNADLTLYGADEKCLQEAALWGDRPTIQNLLETFPDGLLPSTDGCDMLAILFESGDHPTFDFIMQLRKPSVLELECCLKAAIRKDDSRMVRHLLEQGVDSNGSLSLAAKGHPGLLRLLLDSVARPSRDVIRGYGTRALIDMINDVLLHDGNLESLDIILSSNQVDRDYMNSGMTPLGMAISHIDADKDSGFLIIKKLLDSGCDVNKVAVLESDIAKTALMKAIELGDKNLVEFLIKRGADVHKPPRFAVKRSPLQSAAAEGNLGIVKLLLSHEVDVNAVPASRRGGTALQFAAISGNCNVVAELLDNGALLNALPSRFGGRWPIEGAAEHGRLSMIEYLWRCDESHIYPDLCETGFEEKHCQNAMRLAEENYHYGCRDLIAELLQARANPPSPNLRP